jgi:hypothetical protein
MSKGTSTSNKMMPRMDTYGGQNNPGYSPPSGSAGAKAFGEYSTKSNPLQTPKKGSSIGPGYGNADRMKIMGEKDQQARKESLRGMPC